jgi:hypothetical protein
MSDEAIAQDVAKYGWSALSISDAAPPFSYSCGLMTTFDHPELIVFGMESRESYNVLAAMVKELRSGRSFSAPGTYDGILEHAQIAIRRVHPTQHELYLGFAMGHCTYMGKLGGLEALQVFWPDKQGRFPFEVNCDLDVYGSQPRLDLEVPPSELRAFRRQFGV